MMERLCPDKNPSPSRNQASTCQLVNGRHLQPHLPAEPYRSNGLRYPTQEVGQDTRQRQDIPEMPYPIQETGPSAERTPDEHEDLPPCHPQLNDADINKVSSTGERERAVEFNCCPHELQLWRQESDR